MTEETKSVLRNFAILQVLPFLNNLKDLDLSYKTDLDLWDCLGRKKTLSCNQINMVCYTDQHYQIYIRTKALQGPVSVVVFKVLCGTCCGGILILRQDFSVSTLRFVY